MNERSGVVNIGIEGMMLGSAFFGWWMASIVNSVIPSQPSSAIFGITIPILAGVLAALATGVVASLVHAWLSISLRVDQIISGTIINIVALGVTGYLNLLLSRSSTPTG